MIILRYKRRKYRRRWIWREVKIVQLVRRYWRVHRISTYFPANHSSYKSSKWTAEQKQGTIIYWSVSFTIAGLSTIWLETLPTCWWVLRVEIKSRLSCSSIFKNWLKICPMIRITGSTWIIGTILKKLRNITLLYWPWRNIVWDIKNSI